MLKFDWNILWTVINLIIFFVLMRAFLFKPIKKTMDKRKELIEQKFKDADDANAQAEALKQEYTDKLADVDSERNRMILEARKSAKTEYGKMMSRAEEDVQRMKTAAQKSIDAERTSAMRSAKESIASLAMEAAEKVVGANISPETDSAIFDEFLEESSEENES